MKAKVFKPVPVRRHTERIRYPQGNVPISAYMRKHVPRFATVDPAAVERERRRQAEPPRPHQGSGNWGPRPQTRPVPFQPITGHMRSNIPKIKQVDPKHIYDARLFTQRVNRLPAVGKKNPDHRSVMVILDISEYRVLRQACDDYQMPMRTLIRMMIRRFIKKGVLLSAREIRDAERFFNRRQQRTLAKLMDETIFMPPRRGPDKILALNNPKRMRHTNRITAWQHMRSNTPAWEWAKRGLDTYQHFVNRYFPEFEDTTELSELDRAQPREPRQTFRRRLPKPGPFLSQEEPEEEPQDEEQEQRVVNFARERKRRMIRRTP